MEIILWPSAQEGCTRLASEPIVRLSAGDGTTTFGETGLVRQRRPMETISSPLALELSIVLPSKQTAALSDGARTIPSTTTGVGLVRRRRLMETISSPLAQEASIRSPSRPTVLLSHGATIVRDRRHLLTETILYP